MQVSDRGLTLRLQKNWFRLIFSGIVGGGRWRGAGYASAAPAPAFRTTASHPTRCPRFERPPVLNQGASKPSIHATSVSFGCPSATNFALADAVSAQSWTMTLGQASNSFRMLMLICDCCQLEVDSIRMGRLFVYRELPLRNSLDWRNEINNWDNFWIFST